MKCIHGKDCVHLKKKKNSTKQEQNKKNKLFIFSLKKKKIKATHLFLARMFKKESFPAKKVTELINQEHLSALFFLLNFLRQNNKKKET